MSWGCIRLVSLDMVRACGRVGLLRLMVCCSWQGQSASRRYPADRDLHVLCCDAAGLWRGHSLAVAVRLGGDTSCELSGANGKGWRLLC